MTHDPTVRALADLAARLAGAGHLADAATAARGAHELRQANKHLDAIAASALDDANPPPPCNIIRFPRSFVPRPAAIQADGVA